MDTETTQTTTSETTSSVSEAPSLRDAASEAYDEMVAASQPEESSAPEAKATDTREASAEKTPKDAPTATKDEFTWDKVDPRAKEQYETAEKRWKGLQSYVTKEQQKWKANEEKLAKFSELQNTKQQLDYFSKLYDTNPEVKAVLNRALGIQAEEVDPTLAQDPLYKYISEREQRLLEQNRQLEERIKPIMAQYEQMQKQQQEAELDAQVNAVEKSAVTKFTELMGREPSQEETAKIIKHMVEKRVYDGEAAAIAVFLPDIMNRQKQAALEEQMKKKSVGARVSTVNSAKGSGDKYSKMSVKDILRDSLEEMGF